VVVILKSEKHYNNQNKSQFKSRKIQKENRTFQSIRMQAALVIHGLFVRGFAYSRPNIPSFLWNLSLYFCTIIGLVIRGFVIRGTFI